ncbi:MAG TPA: response regulator [Stellaceae bacterium]|nr:response regulator [Stellaceae bacterium]
MSLILLVDDNAELRRTVGRMLTASGHEVLEAGNGNEAMRHLEGAAPALVITDLIMPGKEGIETIIDIRRRGIVTKILAMTGSDPADKGIYLDAASKLGADAVLRKPFRAAELKAIVDRLLGDGL